MWSEWKASIRTHTQQDPIGLAGGLNLYGFAGGDPINFWDPFGLCREGAYDDCQWLVEQLRGVGNRFFNSIAYMCESGDFEVHLTDATDKKLDPFGANRDDDPSNTVLGSTSPGGTSCTKSMGSCSAKNCHCASTRSVVHCTTVQSGWVF